MGAVNIVDVISDFRQVKKSGVNYLALCPWHADKNLGSFIISPKKNICKCFQCGHAGDAVSYLMSAEGMSYPDALRYLGRKYNIEVEGSEKFKDVKRSEPRKYQVETESLPLMVLPMSMYERSTKGLENDVLVKWLCNHHWDTAQRSRIAEALKAYHIGTAHTKDNEQFTVFWYLDENGILCTGKMIRYQYNGKRMKKEQGFKHCTDWVHDWLFRSDVSKQYDRHELDWKRTYFGMHLAAQYPNADINVVESEKTALVMAVAYGTNPVSIWMACGSKMNLTGERMRPLIEAGRHIVLYPDRDAVDTWKDTAEAIGYKHLTVNADPVTKWWRPEDGEKADIADVVLRMTDSHAPYKTAGDVVANNAKMTMLKDRLGLEVIE